MITVHNCVRWINHEGEKVYTYCPPPNDLIFELAKTHAIPISSWGKVDVVNTLFIDMNWDTAWKKYNKLIKDSLKELIKTKPKVIQIADNV